MKDSSGLDQAIDFLEGIEVEAASAAPLFEAHLTRYLDLARKVAFQTLIANPPEGVAPDEWQEEAGGFADLLFARTMRDGFEIRFEHRTEFEKQAAGGGSNFSPITWQDVLDWVNADPEDGGKDITAVEASRDRSPEQIAYDVHNAILQHRLGTERKDFSRIEQRLEEWVNSRVLRGPIDDILRAVLDAWTGALFPVISRDFDDWMHYDVLGMR